VTSAWGDIIDEKGSTCGRIRCAGSGRIPPPRRGTRAGAAILRRRPGRRRRPHLRHRQRRQDRRGVGAAVGYRVNDRWVVLGEFDYGKHKDQLTSSTDINTLHYIAKVGYSLTGPKERGWEAMVNLGAGAVTFDVENAPQNFTYFAINAGAKVAYNF